MHRRSMDMHVQLQDGLFLPWTSDLQSTTKPQKCLEITSSIHGLPLCQELDQYASFSIPKPGSYGLIIRGHCFDILLSWEMCDAIPASVVLFLDQSDETSFCHLIQCCEKSCCLQQHTVTATAIKCFSLKCVSLH